MGTTSLGYREAGKQAMEMEAVPLPIGVVLMLVAAIGIVLSGEGQLRTHWTETSCPYLRLRNVHF